VAAPVKEKQKQKEKQPDAVAPVKEKQKEKEKKNPTVAPVKPAASEAFAIGSRDAAPKKIELDPKLPDGLLFKVQIGAFRHTISGDKFKGVKPLSGETTDKGFIRYTAGMFTQFESADKAKRDIQAVGFKDAFVVAFMNGKRIPINEALAVASGKPGSKTHYIRDNNERDNPVPPETAVEHPTDSTTASGLKTPPASDTQMHSVAANPVLPTVVTSNPAAIAKSTPVTSVSGLFFTVQVGVYSNPVSNEKLHGIQPLNTEKLDNGNLRYTSGQYADPLRAEEARRKIVELGVKDAFIVAYKDGKRVSATDLHKSSGEPAAPRTSPVTSPPVRTTGSDTPVPAGVTSVPAATSDYTRFDSKNVEMVAPDSGIVFKVQIGAFREQVPIDIANKFILLAKRDIKNFKDENGLTVFTIGSVRKYEDAVFLKEEATAKGIPDAFILAYKNGKKITVAEAKGE